MQSKIKILSAFIILGSLVFLSGCFKAKPVAYRVNLEIWGTSDDSSAYGEILGKYREINPFVGEIKYRKFEIDGYKQDLLNALASGQGPDIFLIGNTWLPSFRDKIEPAPDRIMNEQEFRNNFVDVAVSDFLDEGKIYAVPLSVDSLALYYNKDLFNAAGITSPPSTWEELQADVKKLTKIDQYGNIIQQGVALGTAININRSSDILSLLMLQLGTQMTNAEKTQATFNDPVVIGGNSVQSGERAFEFYTQFASPRSPMYSWNPRMHYSIDSFFEGTTAMMLNYSWHYDTIKSKNSKLNFAVAQVPQFSGAPPASPPASPNRGESLGGPVNYANYWALAVAKNKITTPSDSQSRTGETVPDNKVRVQEAWELLKFLTVKNDGKITLTNGISGGSQAFSIDIDPAVEYLKKTGKPAARRDIIEAQKSDPVLGPFAYGNLIAKSWYQADPEAVETILADAINSVNVGMATIPDALELANSRVTQFMRK